MGRRRVREGLWICRICWGQVLFLSHHCHTRWSPSSSSSPSVGSVATPMRVPSSLSEGRNHASEGVLEGVSWRIQLEWCWPPLSSWATRSLSQDHPALLLNPFLSFLIRHPFRPLLAQDVFTQKVYLVLIPPSIFYNENNFIFEDMNNVCS